MDTCPKCGYARQPKDTDPYSECPRCGIIFARYHVSVADVPAAVTAPALEVEEEEPPLSVWQRLWERLFELPEQPDRTVLAAKFAVLAVMVIWGVRLISDRLIGGEIMQSFLHEVDLPIHEFGHVLFAPFGRWVMYLGGSLFQCLLPAILMVVFLWRQRDAFAASFCLWWTAENVLDVAPYIYDGRLMALPLVGEGNESTDEAHVLRHDWHNILEPIGLVNSSERIGTVIHLLGAALMVLAWAWAGYWLWKAWRQARTLGP